MARFRIVQLTPTSWELDTTSPDGGWCFVDRFPSADAARAKSAELVSIEGWQRPEPEYYDGAGKLMVGADT